MKHSNNLTVGLSEDFSPKSSINSTDLNDPGMNNYGLYGPGAFKNPVDIEDLLSH